MAKRLRSSELDRSEEGLGAGLGWKMGRGLGSRWARGRPGG